ncbi:MAG: hypothetical protein SOY32_02895 [Candidatus Faecousia sp.]|nr:hypothetical protein [Bacillota bacterium]MDY4219354.1 hypothetical protein [Candidatus Faecousia sp.]
MMDSMEHYVMWINWEEHVVSFHETPGFDRLPFLTAENMQANIRILLTEGFQFQ